jgi:hypothetical protein
MHVPVVVLIGAPMYRWKNHTRLLGLHNVIFQVMAAYTAAFYLIAERFWKE